MCSSCPVQFFDNRFIQPDELKSGGHHAHTMTARKGGKGTRKKISVKTKCFDGDLIGAKNFLMRIYSPDESSAVMVIFAETDLVPAIYNPLVAIVDVSVTITFVILGFSEYAASINIPTTFALSVP